MHYKYFSVKSKISTTKNHNKFFFSNPINQKKSNVDVNILLNRNKNNNKKENLRKLFLLGFSIFLISIFAYVSFI